MQYLTYVFCSSVCLRVFFPHIASQSTWHILTLNTDFGLEQIIPASDETTGVELEIIGASFCDPYVSLVRDDASITVWQSTSDELVELERADGITAAQWLSASIYKPQKAESALLFALTAEGALRVGSKH